MADKARYPSLYIGRERKKGKKEKDKIGNFLSGVMALSLSTVAVKIIGLVYKIPMLRLLGSEGMGYFNSAYEIYALLCVISTSGLPVATSLMISRCNGREKAAERIFSISMKIFLALGIIGSVIMLLLAYPFSVFLGSQKGLYSILAIAPTLFCICAVSAYRGYFQGLSRMAPTAVSQLIEASGKLVFGVFLAMLALHFGFGTEMVAAFAVFGLLLGSIVSALYLMLLKRRSSNKIRQIETERERGIVKELLRIAIPVTLSSAVISITKMVDMTMILRRLQSIGYNGEQAFSVYGNYTTLAVPLFALAPALIRSVALPIIPRLSKAIAQNDAEALTDTVNDGLRLTCLISMPIGSGLAFFSKQILELIFKGQIAAVELCAPLLSMLGFSVTLSCLVTVGNAMLNAYGRPTVPLISMTVGTLIKTVLAFILIGNPRINIAGAPLSTLFCDLVINLINFRYICKYTPGNINVGKCLVRPFLASTLAVVFPRLFYDYIQMRCESGSIATIASVFISVIIYLILCILFHAVDKNDICKLRSSKT